MDCGILYVAVGDRFLNEATVSARSLRKHMPEIPIAVVHDGQTVDPVFDTGIELSNPDYGFRDKIRGISLSPFNRTVYLDTDIYIDDTFHELFELLDEFEVAASFNPDRDLSTQNLGVPECFPEYNTGVLAYDTVVAADVFEAWASLYQDDHEHDQPSFRKAVYNSDLRIATLTREYNCIVRYPGKVVKPVKLFHGRLININSPGASKYFEIDESTRRINGYEGHRIYHRGGRIAGFPRLSRQIHLLRHSLLEEGVATTVRRVLSKVVDGIR